MKESNIIDFSKTECWMLNLLPFDDAEKTNEEAVFNFQMKCKEDRVFGIGWYLSDHQYGEMTEGAINRFLSDHEQKYKNDSALQNAIKNFFQIKSGHYIVMRLRDAHYYIGKVTGNLHYDDEGKYKQMSWIGTVDKWVDFENDEQMPSEIVGRFSRSQQPTIEKVASIRQRVLIIKAYQNKLGKDDIILPKIRLTKENFCRSLNYRDLEDLVCFFIAKQNQDYMLLPSSCKLSHAKYEYTFVAHNRKPITCQVKNQTALPEIENYTNDKSFEAIYLFSGILTDEDVISYREKYKNYSHIVFISPSELYNTLINNSYFLDKLKGYYELCDENGGFEKKLEKSGWTKSQYFRGKPAKRYRFDSERNCWFDTSWDFFYSEEMDALVYKGTGNKDENPQFMEIAKLFE